MGRGSGSSLLNTKSKGRHSKIGPSSLNFAAVGDLVAKDGVRGEKKVGNQGTVDDQNSEMGSVKSAGKFTSDSSGDLSQIKKTSLVENYHLPDGASLNNARIYDKGDEQSPVNNVNDLVEGFKKGDYLVHARVKDDTDFEFGIEPSAGEFLRSTESWQEAQGMHDKDTELTLFGDKNSDIDSWAKHFAKKGKPVEMVFVKKEPNIVKSLGDGMVETSTGEQQPYNLSEVADYDDERYKDLPAGVEIGDWFTKETQPVVGVVDYVLPSTKQSVASETVNQPAIPQPYIEKNSQTFNAAIDKAKNDGFETTVADGTVGTKKSKWNGAFVDTYSADEYKDMKLIGVADGDAGVAVKDTGDIVSVFKNPNAKVRDAVSILIPEAVKQGGDRLDCFNGFLPGTYALYGFKPVARLKFNKDYAPDNWNYERDGTPDVIFMAHDARSVDEIGADVNNMRSMTRADKKAYKTTIKKDIEAQIQKVPEVFSYEEAAKLQEQAVRKMRKEKGLDSLQ